MNLTILSAMISAALAGAGGFWAAWEIQAANITQMELSHANERIAIQRASRATLEQSMQRVSTAQTQAANRALRAAADNSRAIAELSRLRNTSASALRDAANDINACTSSLAAHSIVVGACSARLVEVARDADQLVSEVILYQDAWPK